MAKRKGIKLDIADDVGIDGRPEPIVKHDDFHDGEV